MLLILNIAGCQNSDTTTSKIENSSMVIMGQLIHSSTAFISNKEEIKEFEDLFNNAEFEETNATLQPPYMTLIFHKPNTKYSRTFLIDEFDTIRFNDGRHFKSKEITFEEWYSIFKDYLSKRERKKIKL